MLLRTVVLLLLCVSTCMCATLVSLQEREREREDLSEKSAAVPDAFLTAVDAEAAVEDQAAAAAAAAAAAVGDKPAAEEPADSFVNKLLEKISAVDDPQADKQRSAGDTPAVEALDVTKEIPSSTEEDEDNQIRLVKTKLSQQSLQVKQNNNTWGLNSIRNSFQVMHGYFDSLVELVGGHNGVCQYRCRYGDVPLPRPGYQLPEPNGCSSSLVGLKVNAALDLGIPAMTQCCNQLDLCYDTCGTSKYDCDSRFRSCLHDICSDLKKSLGFVSQVQACDSMADVLFNTVWTLGCRPYMNSQRAACVCDGEERDEL